MEECLHPWPWGVTVRVFFIFFLAAGCGTPAVSIQPSAVDIVRRSLDRFEADWKQEPKYSYVDHEIESKRDARQTVKTYEVLMIDGSPYDRLIAVNDRPLGAGEQAEQDRLMRNEMLKRQRESSRERNRRINKYLKGREKQHDMFKEMVEAFEFRIVDEENVKGYNCWVLDASPKLGFEPNDREGRVLTGMKGRLWIDKNSDQWVKVRAEVIKPVSFYGFLAKVDPGTQFLLEQEPVAKDLWLPSRFSVKVNASALGFFNEDSSDDEMFRDYKRLAPGSAELQANR